MGSNERVFYREEQRVRSAVVWFVAVATGLLLLVAALAEPLSLAVRLGFVALSVVPVGLLSVTRFVVEVGDAAVVLRLRPFGLARSVPLSTVEGTARRQYRPATPLGKWGVRLGLGQTPTYNVEGDGGVRLTLADGALVVGSVAPRELYRAVERARREYDAASGRKGPVGGGPAGVGGDLSSSPDAPRV
jgi:hypothetical protein